MPKKPVPQSSASAELANEVRHLIVAAREEVARTVNAGLVLLYWQIGTWIHSYPGGEASCVWGGDFADTVGKIGPRVWRRLQRAQSAPNGPARRVFPRP